MVLLWSCFLSFSHLVPVSLDDDLAYGGLLLGFGSFAPLLEPEARDGERTSKLLRARAFLEFVKTRRRVRSDWGNTLESQSIGPSSELHNSLGYPVLRDQSVDSALSGALQEPQLGLRIFKLISRFRRRQTSYGD